MIRYAPAVALALLSLTAPVLVVLAGVALLVAVERHVASVYP